MLRCWWDSLAGALISDIRLAQRRPSRFPSDANCRPIFPGPRQQTLIGVGTKGSFEPQDDCFREAGQIVELWSCQQSQVCPEKSHIRTREQRLTIRPGPPSGKSPEKANGFNCFSACHLVCVLSCHHPRAVYLTILPIALSLCAFLHAPLDSSPKSHIVATSAGRFDPRRNVIQPLRHQSRSHARPFAWYRYRSHWLAVR